MELGFIKAKETVSNKTMGKIERKKVLNKIFHLFE